MRKKQIICIFAVMYQFKYYEQQISMSYARIGGVFMQTA